MPLYHVWTKAEKEYLKQIATGHHYAEIKEMINSKFNMDFTIKQIRNAIKRYNLNTGFTGRFEKGHIPLNKGAKGIIYKGTEKTWFKKGDMPYNYRPVGSERINVFGYAEIKVADPNKWKSKQQVVYERKYGPVPKGCAVIFGDGNKTNFDINNLILVSKQQLLALNKNKLIQADADLTKTAIIITDVYQKISLRKKQRR